VYDCINFNQPFFAAIFLCLIFLQACSKDLEPNEVGQATARVIASSRRKRTMLFCYVLGCGE